MEANECDTENQIAASGAVNRSITTRRTRNNNMNIIMNDKDQENVNNTKHETEQAEQSITEEVTAKSSSSDKMESKHQTPTTNSNSSTPRRKKDPLANLHSNLSPKYIGFTTPPTQLDISNSEEKSRSLRRRHHNLSYTNDTSINKDANMSTGSPFTPNNDTTVGYVRRTPRSKDSQSTPDGKSTRRKDYVSPIDKLLIKNGSMVENNMLPLEENEVLKKFVKNRDEEKMEIEEDVENLPDTSLHEKVEIKETTTEENEAIDKIKKKSTITKFASKKKSTEILSNDETEEETLIKNNIKTKLSTKKNQTNPKLKSENAVSDEKIENFSKNNKSEISSNQKEDTEVSLSQYETESVSNYDENSNDTKIKSKYDTNSKKTKIFTNKENSDKTEISTKHKENLDRTEVSLMDKGTEVSLNHKETPDKIKVNLQHDNSNETKIKFNVEEIDIEVWSNHEEGSGNRNIKSNHKKNFAKTKVSSNYDNIESEVSSNQEEDSEESEVKSNHKDKLDKANSFSNHEDIESEIFSNNEEDSEESEVKSNRKDNIDKANISSSNHKDIESEISSNQEDSDEKVKSNHKEKTGKTEISSNDEDMESEVSSEDNIVKLNHNESTDISEDTSDDEDIETEVSLNHKTISESHDVNSNHKEISNVNDVKTNQEENSKASTALSNHKENSEETEVKSNHKANFNNTNNSKETEVNKDNSEETEVNSNLNDDDDDDTEIISNQDELEFLSIHDDESVVVSNHNDPEKCKQDNMQNPQKVENENKHKVSVINDSIIESPDVPSTKEQIDKSHVKVEVDSIETESNTDFVDASASAKSPSAVSMDSAKGSSIGNEDSWMSFSTGDLYWGQIYNFCYWPCLVCPDPAGKTITTEVHGRSGDQHIMVHVRFFADNGRRNWIKRENLMPYTGLENYQERLDEAKEKYGPKSYKLKLYIPTKKKESVWRVAVNEANEVAEIPYADRLEKFYEIFEKSKANNKRKQQRRKSMYISTHRGSTSDVESFYGSTDHINNLPIPSIKQKRERSISPYSPAYSPIKSVKRRKLSEEQQELPTTSAAAAAVAAASNYFIVKSEEQQQQRNELNLSQTSSVASSSVPSLSDLEIFNNLEFKGLYLIMKDYCLKQNHHEKLEKSLLAAARNFYAIKQISEQIEQRRLRESITESDLSTSLQQHQSEGADGSLKRLSTRLRTLRRKSQQSPFATPDRSIIPAKHVKDSSSIVDKTKKPLEPLNRPILEVIDDIFELDNKYLFKGMSRDPVCKYCFKPAGNLTRCAKNCGYWLHSECLHIDFTVNGKVKRVVKRVNSTKSNNDMDSNNTSMSVADITSEDLNEKTSVPHVTGDTEREVICKECTNKEPVKCMVCKLAESTKDEDPLVKCTMSHCDRAFHPACCKYWPQSKITISKNHIESFRCPSHVCHTCVSDDPKGKFQHLTSGKITKCVKCPATFHTDSTCIPAGSQIMTAAYIICPRHTNIKHDMTVNVNWCFICVGGGQVVCCETCPTAVHAQCLKIPIDPNEGYICEECESGRMPLYGEMIWAKFNNFRWWPAIILPPTEIPKNIAKKTHNPSDFVVRFFGTHDHGWISRRRVYLYLEGDSSEPPKSKSHLDLNYKRGVEEAKEVYEIIKAKKLQQSGANENKERLHPQPYVRIKANRAVPPVKLHVDIDSVSICECDPNDENPCGPDTNCLNRCLYHECNPKVCPAGERCQNQMFESRISPRLDVIYMKERGFGLVCREPIAIGTFVIEYVGEIINDNEFQARMQQKSQDRDENFYFLSVEKDYIIDAGPKGNLARFMNHSCDPNCETQKWQVNSLNRVGLFAIKDIPENTELTFNYHWDDLLGNEKKTCFCGAKRCAGQIGAKLKDIESTKELSTSSAVKNKSKTKSKPVKRLLKGLKGKPGPKLKLNNKTKTKKMAAVAAVSASLETKNSSTSPKTVEDDFDDEAPTSSNRLKSADIFC